MRVRTVGMFYLYFRTYANTNLPHRTAAKTLFQKTPPLLPCPEAVKRIVRQAVQWCIEWCLSWFAETPIEKSTGRRNPRAFTLSVRRDVSQCRQRDHDVTARHVR